MGRREREAVRMTTTFKQLDHFSLDIMKALDQVNTLDTGEHKDYHLIQEQLDIITDRLTKIKYIMFHKYHISGTVNET